MTDITSAPPEYAQKTGVDGKVNVAAAPGEQSAYTANKELDVLFVASETGRHCTALSM